MHNFETNVLELKYNVLKLIAKATFEGNLLQRYHEIPKLLVPGPKPRMRCCIYKERAIVGERMKIALGGNPEIHNVIEVLDIACDECPLGGYEVTDRCRGCIAHRCEKVCRKGAINFDPKTHAAIIDKEKCVNCGMCAKACQYNAIQNYMRPCEQVCPVKAISTGEDDFAKIDDEKCIQCGACVYKCPFGAIMDKSQITQVIAKLMDKGDSHIYACVAPSIAAQFKNVNIGQVVSAIKALGFDKVVEAALGADMVSYHEAKELAEKGFLTSSCCPSFVSYIEKNHPKLKDHISHNLSPMATVCKAIKEQDEKAFIVFIGPCIAKKKEIERPEVKPYVDHVLTFEELEALIDAKEIDMGSYEESSLDNASYYGRIFARSGGLSYAVKEALTEQSNPFEVKAVSADGIENIRPALIAAAKPEKEFNFVEGMMCGGGCVLGPCSLSHETRDRLLIDKHGMQSKKTISKSQEFDVDSL